MQPASKQRVQSRTLARLGDYRIWSIGYAIASFIAMATLTVVTDVFRLSSPTWLWLAPFLISFGVAFALGVAAHFLARKFEGKSYAWVLNLLISAVIGAIKNVTVMVVALAIELPNDVTLTYRAVGGAIGGVLFTICFAAITGSRADHSKAVNRLKAMRSTLLTQRENLKDLADLENKRLVAASSDLLMPKLSRIQENLNNSPENLEIIEQIRNTLDADLRPLTQGLLAFPIPQLPNPQHETISEKIRVETPKYSELPRLLSPTRSLVLSGVSLFSMIALMDVPGSLAATLVLVTYNSILVWALKSFLPRKKIRTSTATLGLIFVAIAGWAPVEVFVVWQGKELVQIVTFTLLSFSTYLTSSLVIGYSLILDSGRKKIEFEIAKENDVLQHEISIFEQKIWVFRKSWQLLLHGKVQAALTAALTRLSLPHNDNSVKLELVRQDLKRAETALQNHPLRHIELTNSIEELSSAWSGVCDVKVSVSERATRALQRNFETMFSVNEIMREAISNAVRHGSSTRVDIEIDRVQDEVIEFICRNNGTLLTVQASQGLGFEMMNELTTEWSLTTEEKSGLTALRARIPVSL